MKNFIFYLLLISCFSLATAQDSSTPEQITKGKTFFELNTGLVGFGEISMMQGSTAFQFSFFDDSTLYNIGFDGGYFIQDRFALKFGLGYGGYKIDTEFGDVDMNSFTYRLGAKYYVSNFPFQLDLTGASIKDIDENPLWLGIQGGYAFFLGTNVSIEPNLRYSLSLNEEFSDENMFQINVGFSVFF